MFPLTFSSPLLYRVATVGVPTRLGMTVTRVPFPLAGIRAPAPPLFSCLINFPRISPLTTLVWAVGALTFPCLILLGTLLVLVDLTSRRSALLANSPGGAAPFLPSLIDSRGRDIVLVRLGTARALLLLLRLAVVHFC